MKLHTIIPLTVFSLAMPHAFADDAKTETKTEATAAVKADVKVEITGNDQMQYDKNAFEVEAGKVVELTFKNIGKLPIIAMGHNVVILAKGVEAPAFAMGAMQAKDNDYIPQDKESAEKMIAHTKLLGPGESDTITFTAPEAGEYHYICTFPGHFAVMKGIMTVK